MTMATFDADQKGGGVATPCTRRSILEDIVRELGKPKKTMTFTAPTEEEARKRFAEWRRSNPNATILLEHKSVLVTARPAASPRQSKQLVSIVIEFVD
jgi:hypothetical protein